MLDLIACLVLLLRGLSHFNALMSWVLPQEAVFAIANFSFITHFEPMMKGLVTMRDLIFFASVIIFSLWVNVILVER